MPGFEHIDRRGAIGDARAGSRVVHVRRARTPDRASDLAQVVEVASRCPRARLGERARAAARRASSRVVAVHDDLREHRIVERRDLRAALDPRLDARVRREAHFGQAARARLEVARPDPRRRRAPGSSGRARTGERCSSSRRLARAQGAPSTRRGRCRSLPRSRRARPAGACSPRGSRTSPRSRVVDELDRAGRAIAHRASEPHRRVAELARARSSAESGAGVSSMTFWLRRCSRAVALAERDDLARAVAEDLHLDVARAARRTSRGRRPLAEVALRQPLHGLERARELAASLRQTRMPMPPPPAVLFSITG